MAVADNQSPNGMGDTDNNFNKNQNVDDLPKWISQLPENLRDNDKLYQYRTLADLSNAYLDLDGKTNGAIQVPGENASDDDWATFYNKLGRPNKPDDYEFDAVQWPENMANNMKELLEEDTKTMKSVFHELGLTAQQAKNLQKKYVEFAFDRFNESEKAKIQMHENAVNSLKKEWGNDYDVNAELAVRAFNRLGELAGIKDEFTKFMNNSGLGSNPMFVKIFHVIGKSMQDDKALDSGGTPSSGTEKDVPRGPDGRPRLQFPSMEKKR